MQALKISLIAVAALLAFAPSVSAADQSLTFTAKNDASSFWFEVSGYTGKNPTVRVAEGDNLTVTLTNAGNMPHDLNFRSPVNAKTKLLTAGQSETITFTVPAGMTDVEYFCSPHETSGMLGKMTTQAAGTAPVDGNGGGKTPGFGAFAVVVGLGVAVFLLRRK